MRLSAFILFLVPLLLFGQVAKENDPQLSRINVSEHLGEYVPGNTVLYNEQGEKVLLKEYFNEERPVVFVFAYYECPMLCTLVLNGLSDAINAMNWPAGERYSIVTVSIDSAETPALARQKKETYTGSVSDTTLRDRWHFLTADQPSIDSLTTAMGFEYFYDEERDEFAHPAVLFILTPEGKIARHLYGIQYTPNDVKLALLEASDGKVGNTFERILLYCYHYDANANSYVLFAGNVMRLGGVLTIAVLGLFLGTLWVKEKRKKQKSLKEYV